MVDSQTGKVAAVCPVCDTAWPPETEVCPNDGSWLNEKTRVDIKLRTRQPTFGAEDTSKAAMPYPFGETNFSIDPALLMDPARPPKDLAPGTKAGEYEIESKIGEGAMGTVYRAVHPAIGKHVAIKVMSPRLFEEADAIKRFLSEARAVAAIRHPGIVDVFGFGRLQDGRTFLTMEWLDGMNLATRLAQGPLPYEEALDLIRHVARALDAAHQKNIIHRDLKPENVFLVQLSEDERVVKLLDFGLAKLSNREEGVAVTKSGQILGTPLYMSPEQCRSKGVDHRTDIYALGCLAYKVLCGRVPFDKDNTAELISAHLTETPPRARTLNQDLPLPLDDLLFKMIAKDPAERPTIATIRRTIQSTLMRASQPMLAVNPDGAPVSPYVDLPSQGYDVPAVSVRSSQVPVGPAATADTVQAESQRAVSQLEAAITAPDAANSLSLPAEKPRWWIPVAIAAGVIAVIALAIFAFSTVFQARQHAHELPAPTEKR